MKLPAFHSSATPIPHELLVLVPNMEVKFPMGNTYKCYHLGFLAEVYSKLGEPHGELEAIENPDQYEHLVTPLLPAQHRIYTAKFKGQKACDLVLYKNTPLGPYITVISGPKDPDKIEWAAQELRKKRNPVGILYTSAPERKFKTQQDFIDYFETLSPFFFGIVGVPVDSSNWEEELAMQLDSIASQMRGGPQIISSTSKRKAKAK